MEAARRIGHPGSYRCEGEHRDQDDERGAHVPPAPGLRLLGKRDCQIEQVFSRSWGSIRFVGHRTVLVLQKRSSGFPQSPPRYARRIEIVENIFATCKASNVEDHCGDWRCEI
jgi:hypothetical protein